MGAIDDIVAQLTGQPGPPLVITPPAATPKASEDNWTAPVPTMTPPPVSVIPMGQLAAQRPTAPQMGSTMTQPVQPAPTWQSMLQGRSARSQPDIGAIREINPGITWGGKDRNVMLPEDVQASRFYGHPIEGL